MHKYDIAMDHYQKLLGEINQEKFEDDGHEHEITAVVDYPFPRAYICKPCNAVLEVNEE